MDKTVTIAVREQLQLSPDSPYVYHPRWSNAEKTKLRAIVRMPDGRLSEVEASRDDKRSPLLRDILAQYTEDEIQLFTDRHNLLAEAGRQRDQRMAEDRKAEAEREETARAKATALNIPAVRDLADKRFRSRILRARSPLEVSAWTALALMEADKG
jgi:hypothetical protein